MHLRKYLSEKNLSILEFSRLIGISRPTLYRVLMGADIHLSTAYKIYEFTNKEVTLQELLPKTEKINTFSLPQKKEP